MSQTTPDVSDLNISKEKDVENDTNETVYYFDQKGVHIPSDNVITSENGKPGQITSSYVPDLLENRISTHQSQGYPGGPDSSNHEIENLNEDNLCGFGGFHPQWMQRFASKKAFMVVFSILAIIQSMCWSYFTATITTLEKRFKISSQTAGKTKIIRYW